MTTTHMPIPPNPLIRHGDHCFVVNDKPFWSVLRPGPDWSETATHTLGEAQELARHISSTTPDVPVAVIRWIPKWELEAFVLNEKNTTTPPPRTCSLCNEEFADHPYIANSGLYICRRCVKDRMRRRVCSYCGSDQAYPYQGACRSQMVDGRLTDLFPYACAPCKERFGLEGWKR